MAATSKEVRRSIKAVRASVRGKVHKSVSVRVSNICNLIDEILPRADELGGGSEEMHVLYKTATDYLPGALGPYLGLPREFAERNPLSDGRTAIQVLCAQLDVMYAQLWQIAEAILRLDGDKLITSERFLEDKFGATGNPLNIPPGSGSGTGPGPGSSGGQPGSAAPQPPLSKQLLQTTIQHFIDRMRERKQH